MAPSLARRAKVNYTLPVRDPSRSVRSLVVALGFVFACGPQRPPKTPLVPHDVTVYIAMSDAAAETDTGNVAAMVEALEAKLTKEGYVVTIVAARRDERPPVPRLELQVLSSDSGDATARGAGNLVGLFGAAGLVGSAAAVGGGVVASSELGTMLVDAYVVRGGDEPAIYLGRISTKAQAGGAEAAIDAGRGAGNAIARRALGGESMPPPSSSSAPSSNSSSWTTQ
jgi:hypothetical protein